MMKRSMKSKRVTRANNQSGFNSNSNGIVRQRFETSVYRELTSTTSSTESQFTIAQLAGDLTATRLVRLREVRCWFSNTFDLSGTLNGTIMAQVAMTDLSTSFQVPFSNPTVLSTVGRTLISFKVATQFARWTTAGDTAPIIGITLINPNALTNLCFVQIQAVFDLTCDTPIEV